MPSLDYKFSCVGLKTFRIRSAVDTWISVLAEMNKSIIIRSESDAFLQISQAAFLGEWLDLYRRCPWSTAFQSPEFVCTWYATYRQQFHPVIVSQFANGKLSGLLTLAIAAGGRMLVGAGDYQAEYQVWLSDPADESFVEGALSALTTSFPGVDIIFTYLPPNAAVPTLLRTGTLRRRTHVIPLRRPLVRIEKQHIDALLATKSNRTRFRRLAKEGDFRLDRITNTEGLSAILDDVVVQYNFRQGAINDSLPFVDDPLRRRFHVALMRDAARLNGVMVLRVGSRIAAALIALVDRETAYLCILTHSPFFARHSPGRLLILLSQKELAECGIRLLDLTPGGHHWKDDLANGHEEVAKLILYRSSAARFVERGRRGLIDAAKRGLQRFGISPLAVKSGVKAVTGKLTKMRPRDILPGALQLIYSRRETQIYKHDGATMSSFESSAIQKDKLSDLLNFGATHWRESRQDFLSAALHRLEKGEHVYTYVRDGKLLGYAWLLENQTKVPLPDVGQEFVCPEGSAVLYGFYAHPTLRGDSLSEKALQQMLADATGRSPGRPVYACVSADSGLTESAMERNGFRRESSYRHSRFLTSVRRHADKRT